MAGKLREYWSLSSRIGALRGRPLVVELGKLLLYRAITGYGSEHYLTYGLYQQPVNLRRWREYVDKKDWCRILFQFNAKEHFAVLEDKVAFAGACERLGIPHPRVFGAINYTGATELRNAKGAREAGELIAALPLGDYIVKVCGGSYGEGFLMFSPADGWVHVHSEDSEMSLDAFAARLARSGGAYLLQERLRPARALEGIMPGEACGTLRVNTLYLPDGEVDIFCVFFKLPVIGAYTDNFAGGTLGNMLAFYDLEGRAIRRVIVRGGNGLLRDITHHPDTGERMLGFSTPEVDDALNVARQCAAAFSDIPLVGWDIALTETGPLVLEGNPMFDPVGPQLCAGRGIRNLIHERLEARG